MHDYPYKITPEVPKPTMTTRSEARIVVREIQGVAGFLTGRCSRQVNMIGGNCRRKTKKSLSGKENDFLLFKYFGF